MSPSCFVRRQKDERSSIETSKITCHLVDQFMSYSKGKPRVTMAHVEPLFGQTPITALRTHTATDTGAPQVQARLLLVVATIAINVITVGLLTFASWSDWKTGVALNLVDNSLLLWSVAKHRDLVLARFMVFGLAVGFSELAADAWLVEYTKTLDYSVGGGPMLWRSPLWMPFAWEIVAVQFGYVGWWLWNRFGGWGLVGNGLLGAINIPYYEEMARQIHWWQYSNCRMLSYTPYYIILGEFGIAIMLAILAKRLTTSTWADSLRTGTAGGIGIFLCYALAYGITDGVIPR